MAGGAVLIQALLQHLPVQQPEGMLPASHPMADQDRRVDIRDAARNRADSRHSLL